MKFLADMGISPKTISSLQSLGQDAVHLHNEGLDRLPDSAILQKARDEQRVLLTHDLDFGELIAASEASMPSVVIFRLRNMRPKQVNHYLNMSIHLHLGHCHMPRPVSLLMCLDSYLQCH